MLETKKKDAHTSLIIGEIERPKKILHTGLAKLRNLIIN